MKTLTKIIIVLAVITVALVLMYSDQKEKVSNFAIIAWAMVFVTALASTFRARQWHYSRKAVFYEDAEANSSEENRAVPLCPGPEIPDGGYFWTYPGASALLSEREDEVFVSFTDLVSPGRNVVFKGRKIPATREQLLTYLRGNVAVFRKIVSPLTEHGKIYVVMRLPYNIEKNSYSLKGGYPLGSDKFDSVMKILFRHKAGLATLSESMKKTFQGSLQFSQDTMQSFRRISTDVQTANKSNVPQNRDPVQLGREEQ